MWRPWHFVHLFANFTWKSRVRDAPNSRQSCSKRLRSLALHRVLGFETEAHVPAQLEQMATASLKLENDRQVGVDHWTPSLLNLSNSVAACSSYGTPRPKAFTEDLLCNPKKQHPEPLKSLKSLKTAPLFQLYKSVTQTQPMLFFAGGKSKQLLSFLQILTYLPYILLSYFFILFHISLTLHFMSEVIHGLTLAGCTSPSKDPNMAGPGGSHHATQQSHMLHASGWGKMH